MALLNAQIALRSGSFSLVAAFEAAPGTAVLFGGSGAGKTTVLDCIAGLRAPDAGVITLDGETLFDSARRMSVKPHRRRIGYVQQAVALFPHLTVLENVRFGMREREPDPASWLERVGIAARGRALPAQLSGGERQRVAIARALATRPRLLLLDEPFSGLDAATKFRLLDELPAWIPADIPVLFVTHDLAEAFSVADQVIEIEGGAIIGRGSAERVLGEKRDRLVGRLQHDQKPMNTGSG